MLCEWQLRKAVCVWEISESYLHLCWETPAPSLKAKDPQIVSC